MTQPARTTKKASVRSVLLAALLSTVVLIPLLGHKPLTDWDEGIYAEVSREMLHTGWLVPHWNQQLWFEKPPLMLWITAALFRVFSISELTSRLGSAFAGVALISVLHLWLERRLTQLAAWLSTVMLLGTFGFLHICRVGEMDVLLSFGCVLGLIGLTEVANSSPGGWYVFWPGAATAVMTKGAAAAPLFLVVLMALFAQRWRGPRFSREFWLGFALFLAVVAPWHIAMIHMFGREFLDEYLGLHVWSRATEQIEGHHTRWWFYLKVLLVSAPPFALLYPPAVFRAFRTGVLRIFALFGLVVVIFYSLVQTRLPHYIAPSYPAFTAVTAVWLAHHVAEARARELRRSFWIKAVASAISICVVAILLTARPRAGLHSAILPGGGVLPDNKEAIALVRHAPPTVGEIPGALLVWRKDAAPINTVLFYAQRPVQQVELTGDRTSGPYAAYEKDRYTNDPVPLQEAVNSGPALILIDHDLLAKMPPTLAFHLIEQGRETALGSVQRVPILNAGRP